MAQTITPVNINAKSGDCTATPQTFVFTITTPPGTAPVGGYVWKIGEPSVAGTAFPTNGSIKAVGGVTTNGPTGVPEVELANTGSTASLSINVSSLSALEATYLFSLIAYDGATVLFAEDITITVAGSCAAAVCCAIGSTPAPPANLTKDPGDPFPTIKSMK
jgi:hypothetical protein